MPGHSAGVDDVLILHGRLQTGAVGELADKAAVDFLPGCLAFQFGQLKGGAAGGQLVIRCDQINAPAPQIDPYPVAGSQQREAAADRRFGRDVEDGGAGRGAVVSACP